MANLDLGNTQIATKVPFNNGPIHFVGIGGIGMSGIAEVMLNLGYVVQGSDGRETDNKKTNEAWGHDLFRPKIFSSSWGGSRCDELRNQLR